MISALELRQQMAFALDAEGSDYYRDDLDYIPAINAAIKWLTSVVNLTLGSDKMGEEFFRDVAYSGVFQTSQYSRVSLTTFPSEAWTILSVFPLPTTGLTGLPNPNIPDTESGHRPDLKYITSVNDCKRLTVEEWSRNRDNPFEAGYEGNSISSVLTRYCYLSPYNHSSLNSGVLSQEVEIRPAIPNSLVAIFWIKKPELITTINDNIEFPSSTFQLLFNKALQYIAYKQGDGSTIMTATQQDMQLLLSVI
jgi:hypothetical protein